jgi:uncharacterized protein (TIGR02996 family)
VTDQAALLAAIRDNPEDDTPRLVYADWLQEHGDEARAEFIRVDCEKDRTPEGRRHRQLDDRGEKLLKKHDKTWAGPLAGRGVVESYEYRRGFVALIELSAAQFARHAKAVFAHNPMIEDVYLTAGGPWKACFSRPEWKWVRSLGFNDNIVTPVALRRLVESPHATGLRELSLNFNPIGPPGAATLSGWQHIGNLEGLSLLMCDLGDRGAELILEALEGSHIKSLSLAENHLSDFAAIPLADAELPSLTELDLFYNDLTATGAAMIAASKAAATLTELNLHSNPIGDAGADALIASPHLKHLRELRLMGCDIGRAAAARLRKRFGRGVVTLQVR